MTVVMYFAPAVLLADQTAHAAPIVDPRAPVPFQPTMTQGSAGTPVVNIPAPNANGLSVSQFQSLSVGAEGLIFDNSLVAGTSLTGGQVGANPNLAGRTASTILAQVSSTGSQYASVIAGPLEVFGNTAALIIANPNGISIPGGTSLTNISNLTLTTGTPQFITAAGGTATSYANASALAYSVSSGNIAINGAPGNDGTPGPGIAGTVGNIDLIGQTLTVDAPIQADSRVNLISGNQLVTPTAAGAAGTTYGTSSNGTANTAAAIGNGGIAIDASQFGSVTSGQVYIVSTAAGMGVNQLGALSATAGNAVVNSSGDITVGQTFASQNVNLTSAGNTSMTDAGLANQNYTVSAAGDIDASGAVSAGQDVSLTAGGNLNAASVAANGTASLVAGNAMTLGSLSAQNIALQTTAGDLTINSALTAPGTVTAAAGRDLTINGAVQGGSTVTLTGARNATVNGTVSSVGDTGITAQTGSVSVAGDVQTNGALTVTAAQNATLGGTTQAQGAVSITATNGSVSSQGDVASSNGAVTLQAGQDIATTGNLQGGTTVTASAGRNATLGGTVTAPGAVAITAGQDATLDGAATAGSTLTVQAGGNASINGTASSVGDMVLTATAGVLSATGDVVSLGALTAGGAQGVSLGGSVYSQGNAAISSSAGSVTVAGTLSGPGAASVSAGQDAIITGTVHTGGDTSVSAGRDVSLDGGVEVDGSGNLNVNAGRDLNGVGTLNVASDTSLVAGRNLAVSGAIQTGNNLDATAAQNLSVAATTAVGSETLAATGGSVTLTDSALSGGDMSITAGTDINAQGSVQTLGNLNVNAQGGSVTASGPVSSAGNATLNAGQNLTLNGQTTVAQDAVLTGTNITTQGLAVGGNLAATATNSLDTSAGQLNAAYDANAPTLSVNGNATLSGANVTTANAVIGGTYTATASQTLTTGGTAAYMGDASLSGASMTNVGTQMAAGNLNVSGGEISNQGLLSSLQTASVNATDLGNSGSIYGSTANINVADSLTNSGALLATNALTISASSLNNTNGLIFAGDVNNPNAATGDVTVNVTGGNGSFNNTSGQILGQNSLTLNLPNQAIDPSSATMGTLNGGNAFNLSVQSINNTGAWVLPDTTVNVTASQGISNAGTISQASGSLALNGDVTNSGTVAAQDLTINGSLANQAGATVQANDAFTLNGSGTNAGTVEAQNALNISGSSYDNSNGVTQAGNATTGAGNMAINLSGDLTNAGGTITATNDLSITANSVVNTGASAAGTTTTTTTTVDNSALLMSMVIGTEAVYANYDGPTGVLGSGVNATVPLTLGGLLSASGTVPDAGTVWYDDGVPDTSWPQRFQPAQLEVPVDSQTAPVATSGTVEFVDVPTVTSWNAMGIPVTQNDWYVQDGAVPTSGSTGAYATMTVALPSVTETTTTTGGSTVPSVIAAGNNLSLQATSLDNTGSTISAGNDANINVQSLANGGSTYSSTVTDTVDAASLNAFLSAFSATSFKLGGAVSVMGSIVPSNGWSSGYTPAETLTVDAPGTVTAPSVSSSVTVQGQAGQIVAGHNVNLSGGNLTNAGTIAAANDVNITASSFTNQGTNTGTMTTTAGCAAGFSAGCSSLNTTNPNSQTYSYQQINANVTAGNDIVIAANTVSNTYGNLVAGRNVVIGGAGTVAGDGPATPASVTQAAGVTNTSGAIAAGNDVDINAASLVNTIAAPVQIHQNYGGATPFAGCSSNCEAYVDVQSAAPSTITANHNVNLNANTFANTGSLITGLNNVTINATTSASSDNQYLNAYWHANVTSYDASFPAWGCAGNAALCAQLYGSAYQSGQAQDPAGLPDAVGLPDFVAGTIQAGNTLAVNSPTLTNTGNVIGQTVNLTGSTLVNGITNPNVYTPPPAIAGQVIPLGPPSVPAGATTTVNSAGQVTTLSGQPTSVTGGAGLPSNTPIGTQTVGKPVAPPVANTVGPAGGTTVQTVGGQSVNVTYLFNSPASAVTNDLSPAALIAALPSNLQPGTTQFYYDPYTQAQQVEQAALQATGQSSFYAMPSQTDSQSQTSINNQDTAALYGAALQYAEQNNVALGTQLSQAQLAQINAPMLWYVEQTVPEPGCTATGNGACPTVQALMPEVLLPQNYASVSADGEISGTNVTLNYANSILNTGSISAQNLTVNTGTLTNEQRSTNVGTIYQEVSDGVAATTGTVVQQGGFMSAANYSLTADTINQISGTLQQVNADGSANNAATAQLLASLKDQLGGNFTQSTVSNDLTTSMAYSDGGMGFMSIIGMVAAAVISIYAGPEVLAAYESAMGAGVLATGLAAATTGFAASAASQLVSTGSLNLGSAFETALVAGISAGLASGITYSGDSGFGFSMGGSSDSLANLAGVQPSNGSLVPQATGTLANLPGQALGIAGEALIQAGAQAGIEGGSFLDALRNAAVGDVAAAGAFDIGDAQGSLNEAEYIAAHAALGCAAGAATGAGCGGGAIGGATSALLSPAVMSAIDPTGAPLTNAQIATVTALSMLAGGGLADLAGQNATAGTTAAENEALNNGTKHWVQALVCLLCWSPPQTIGSQSDAGSGPMDPKDALELIKEDDIQPVIPDPFKQNPPGK
ncbi:filamentous hemagglutinin [Paraburkholderia sp. B3]|uniref:two-partner secretion domain-containing protein n=1 Tax=Paraburkholderia sp. B3 TaxID=3134791 RepID=UPI003982D62C